MNRMGGTCSMHRQRGSSPWRGLERSHLETNSSSSSGKTSHRSLRHSVVSAIPDCSIAYLYPKEDNYVNEENNRRSPKSLAQLCTDEVCRSLPYLDGELPPGLPQDVVDDIVHSLIRHSALNATTLRALKNCELGILSLAGCRGVTDEWLKPLSSRKLLSAPDSPQNDQYTVAASCDSMDLDDQHYHNSNNSNHSKKPHQIFYGTFDHNHQDRMTADIYYKEAEGGSASSCCSTSSFVSATSNLYGVSGVNDKYAALAHHDIPTTPPPRAASSSSTNMLMLEDHPMMPTETYSTCTKMEDQFCSPPPSPPSCPISPVQSVTANLTLLDIRGSQRLTDKGLMQLTDLGSLEVAKLDNCHSLVGRGLLALASSHRLHTLSLANCRRLTDEAIINISHLLSLEALSLDGCRCLTDRSLVAISGLYELRKLDLSQCDLITDNGLEQLEHLELVEELSLGWCRSITDRGLDILTTQPGRSTMLRILRLARCLITDDGVENLGRLTNLEELDLNGCANIGGVALGNTLEQLSKLITLDVSYCPGIVRSSWQGKIKCLKTLELCYSGVKDSHLAKFTSVPTLEELNLDSCPVGDWAIAHLADNNVVPNLSTLDLADTDLTDLGMVHLPKFKNLTRLSLFYCNITNAGLRYVAQLTSLEALNLDSRDISDEGMCHLRNLKKLRSLDVFSGRISDSGCEHISQIKSLESLELCGGCIGDPGCASLAKLNNLTCLNLSQNERITNRGAAALATLSNLKALNLSNTRVNVAALRFLGGLMKLQSLALYGCRGIDDDNGVQYLQNGLPSLKCLRLNTTADEDGMVVSVDDGEFDGEGQDDDLGIDDESATDIIQHHRHHHQSHHPYHRYSIRANNDNEDNNNDNSNGNNDNENDNEINDMDNGDVNEDDHPDPRQYLNRFRTDNTDGSSSIGSNSSSSNSTSSISSGIMNLPINGDGRDNADGAGNVDHDMEEVDSVEQQQHHNSSSHYHHHDDNTEDET